jgi:nucleotide-binding universal stress UspA family protein
VLSAEREAANYSHQVSQEGSMAATAEGVKLIPHVVHGDAVEVITRFVREQGFELLVVGYAGHSAMFGHNWGSSSRKLAELSPCSVLVAK